MSYAQALALIHKCYYVMCENINAIYEDENYL